MGAGLWACSSVNTIRVDANDSVNTDVVSQGAEENSIDSIIAPYKNELQAEMSKIIAYAEQAFETGRPSGSLNNWAADALLESQIANARLSAPTFSLLNVGGLRNTINIGDVTLGDIFKIMPFDNEIVWVEMPVEALADIAAYLKASGGEPIAGAFLKNGVLMVDGMNEETKTVWIITSDYLMNGGDKMNFFTKKISVSHTNELLRDAFIREAERQKMLVWSNETRIEL